MARPSCPHKIPILFRSVHAATRLVERQPAPDSSSLALVAAASRDTSGRGDAFHLLILHGQHGHRDAQVLAIYGNARVIEPFQTKNPESGHKPPRNGAVADSPEGPGDRFRRIIQTHETIRQCLEGSASANGSVPTLPNAVELCRFGEVLFETLFVGNVRRLYDVARSEIRDGPLNVILTCTIPWLAEKPWEFAFDPSRRKFLVTEEIHFVRNVLTAVPAQKAPPQHAPLKMLVVAAQPVGTVELAENEEADVVRHGFQSLIDAGLIQVDVLTRATPAALHERIQTKSYDVVHFVGHGDFDAHAHEGMLIFETADGGVHEVDRQTLREILCTRGIQLVFLNACESGRDAGNDLNRGVAQSLMEGGILAVVANQYKVLDPSAVAFADHFYWSLAQGASLGEAAREARIAVNYSLTGEVIDWAVPVLYARDPDFRLMARLPQRLPKPPLQRIVQPRPESGSETAQRAVPAKHRSHVRSAVAVTEQPLRFAIADLAHAFPELEQTLTHLNSVQNRFEFLAVEIVAPLGTWRLLKDKETGKSISYLHADSFANRLKTKPKEFGVDYLVCITNWPMMCDESDGSALYNIYGWWPDKQKVPIILFSTAQLPIPPRGPETDRILANAMVTAITGMLTSWGTHARNPKDCPLYFNSEREMKLISGFQRFDRECRSKLAKVLPKELPALEAMLKAFHQEQNAVSEIESKR